MNRRPLLIALAAGFASATGFVPIGLWPVTLVCFAMLIVLIDRAATMRRAALIGWLFGVGHFTLSMNWIAGAFRYQETMPVWLGGVAVVVLALYLAVYPMIAAALAWRLTQRGARDLALALLFAGLWIVTEYGRATLFTGYAWNPLSAVLIDTQAIGVTRWVGTYGLSGLTVLVAGLLALAPADRRWIAGALAASLVMAGAGLAGTSHDPGATARRVRIVQPDTSLAQHHDVSYDEQSVRVLERLTGPPGAAPRLILWPEGAVPFFVEDEAWSRQRLADLLGPNDVLITGGNALIYDAQGKVTAARNSLFALTPDARVIARYDKAHLVPYGEYLPMRPLLTAIGLSRLVPGDLDFLPGPGPRTIALPGFGKAGIQICYEIVFSGEVVDRVHRPDFLFNASTDAWFGDFGPPQHLAQARMRAIEEGLPIVRATPTGISAVIDSQGILVKTLPFERPGVIDALLPAPAPPTLFALYGNILPMIFAAMLAMAGVALDRRRR